MKVDNLNAVDVAVLCGGNGLDEKRYAKYFGEVADWLSLTHEEYEESTLPDNLREHADVVILGFNPSVCAQTVIKLDAFVKAGGKLLVACRLPKAVGAILGVRQIGELWQEDWMDPEITGMMPVGEALAPCKDYVVFTRLGSYKAPLVKLTGPGTVAATWASATNVPRSEPNVIVTSSGTFVSYLWFRGGNPSQRAYLEGLFRTVLPANRVKAKPVPEGFIKTPASAKEHRGVWTSLSYGLPSMGGWDGTCKFLKNVGVTDVYVAAGAATAPFASRIRPARACVATKGNGIKQAIEAAHKYGLKCHATRSCWRTDFDSDPLTIARERAEGHLQLWCDLKTEENWRCPTNPRNREIEVASFEELAASGVDGITLDFIRYDGEHLCFCDGCRRRFEEQIGSKIANWPQDVRRGGPYFDAWCKFRIDAISDTVREVATRARATNPKIIISATVIQKAFSYDEKFAGWDHVSKIAQDVTRWLNEGWLDYACPMDYYTNTRESMIDLASRQEATSPGKIYPAFAMAIWTRPEGDAETMATLVTAIRDAGCKGWMLYTLADDRAEYAWPHVHEP